MGLRDFFGILPPYIPYDAPSGSVDTLPTPDQVTLLCSGATRDDLAVAVGDHLKLGSRLLRDGAGLAIATVTGRVSGIGAFTDADGHHAVTVTIGAVGEDEIDSDIAPLGDETRTPEALLRAGARAGIPGFDLLLRGARPQALIVSAVDEAPLMTANQHVLAEDSQRLKDGLSLLMRMLGLDRAVLAVPQGTNGAAAAFAGAGVTVQPVPGRYPLRLPEMLARNHGAGDALREVPGGRVGNTLVLGAEYTAAFAAAIHDGQPFAQKLVTCQTSDGSLRTVRARIGTPLASVMEQAGVRVPQDGDYTVVGEQRAVPAEGKLIVNGPMRGYACMSLEQPVMPTSSALMVQSPEAVHRFHNIPCGNCGRCNAVCPVDLEVNMLGRFAEHHMYDKCESLGVHNCIRCGLCGYVCSSHRPVVQTLVHAQTVLAQQQEAAQAL